MACEVKRGYSKETYVFMEIYGKLSLHYHQILTLSVSPSDDSDQPARSFGFWATHRVPCTDLSERVDMQTDLSLWAYWSFWKFESIQSILHNP